MSANVEIGKSCSRACMIKDAMCFAITEEGTGNCKIYPFESIEKAREVAGSWWCCWVLFDFEGVEHGSGGIGTAHKTCR